jgi:predicted DNA-binding transcriptional regulator AlpA
VSDLPDFITIKEACAIVGGTKPISQATFYREVKAGRLPAPEHPSPGISRVRRGKLIAKIDASTNGGA